MPRRTLKLILNHLLLISAANLCRECGYESTFALVISIRRRGAWLSPVEQWRANRRNPSRTFAHLQQLPRPVLARSIPIQHPKRPAVFYPARRTIRGLPVPHTASVLCAAWKRRKKPFPDRWPKRVKTIGAREPDLGSACWGNSCSGDVFVNEAHHRGQAIDVGLRIGPPLTGRGESTESGGGENCGSSAVP